METREPEVDRLPDGELRISDFTELLLTTFRHGRRNWTFLGSIGWATLVEQIPEALNVTSTCLSSGKQQLNKNRAKSLQELPRMKRRGPNLLTKYPTRK